jgi:hypothetical protein
MITKIQCPHCQCEGIAAGTSGKKLIEKPYLNENNFVAHEVKQHHLLKSVARKLFKRLTR